ncbi:MAG: type I secretion system permease/ATPase [Candidatus Endonucleobacter bathymodioli]|uniref:Type I secretion system permease/ATPase n=1 Tax=Candidatus Endonucleibacter bathymodioli TaxID=539814 RepID=A0AA90NJM0_9GAMM|nr:type I secretion system permease/ATPase [Candidatus Endonucleobacter bathymodioli]
MNSVPTKDSWGASGKPCSRADPLLDCLKILTRYYGNPYSSQSLTVGLPLENGALTPELFIRAAERASLSSKLKVRKLSDISSLVVPAVLLMKERKACILLSIDNDTNQATIISPDSEDGEQSISLDNLTKYYDGSAIYVREKHRYDMRTPQSLNVRSRHWFWGTILGSWRIYRDVIVASLLINIFVLVSPMFTMNVYDRVVPNAAFDTLWVLALGAFIIFSFDLVMKTIRGYFIDLAGKKSDILISSRVMERVLGLKMSAKPVSVGSFAKNLQDFDSIRDFITSSTIAALVDLPFTLIILIVIAILGGPIVIIPITGMIIIGIYSCAIQGPLKNSVEKTLRSGSQKNAVLIESLSGMETIKIAQAEGEIQRRWEKVVGHIATWNVKTKLLSASASNFSAYIQQLTTVCNVIGGVYLITDGALSMGGLIAISMLSGRCLAPMAMVANLATRYNQAKSALSGLNEVMQMPIERPNDRNFSHRPDLKGDLEFDSVSFKYPGEEVHAIRDVSLKIKAGERVGIIGRIGSGKTTLGKMILNLYEPEAGAIRADGIDLRQINPSDLRRCIGCVSQDIILFFGSIKDNIVFGASYVDDEMLLRAAEISGVTEFSNKHPLGLDMNVGERGQNLSGGQRQSIAIARALLMDPSILVLDEPTSAMDNTTELRIKSQLTNDDKNKTLILITHKASMLELVDRIIVVDGGHIIADDSKERILTALKLGKLKMS